MTMNKQELCVCSEGYDLTDCTVGAGGGGPTPICPDDRCFDGDSGSGHTIHIAATVTLEDDNGVVVDTQDDACNPVDDTQLFEKACSCDVDTRQWEIASGMLYCGVTEVQAEYYCCDDRVWKLDCGSDTVHWDSWCNSWQADDPKRCFDKCGEDGYDYGITGGRSTDMSNPDTVRCKCSNRLKCIDGACVRVCDDVSDCLEGQVCTNNECVSEDV